MSDRLQPDQIHDGRWQDHGAYVVYRGGKLRRDASDVTGRKLVGGVVVGHGKVGGPPVTGARPADERESRPGVLSFMDSIVVFDRERAS